MLETLGFIFVLALVSTYMWLDVRASIHQRRLRRFTKRVKGDY